MVQEYFPCSLNIKGRNCWVIGWSRETLDKVGKLLGAGARVTAVAPDFPSEIQKDLRRQGVRVLNRAFKLSDIKTQFFVIFCLVHEKALARKIATRCRSMKILLCAIDQPKFCDVVNVSVYKKGLLQMTIGTGGAAPAVSRKIREGLEASLKNVSIDKYLEYLGSLRGRVDTKGLLKAAEGFSFKAGVKFPARWNRK